MSRARDRERKEETDVHHRPGDDRVPHRSRRPLT